MQTRIKTILSDYDGTLSTTDTFKNKTDSIPKQLEEVLCIISQSIPLCIISSKDYHFLHPRTGFAGILSCIMGIETVSHTMRKETSREIPDQNEYSDVPGCIRERYLLPNSQKLLQTNSNLLFKLAQDTFDLVIHNILNINTDEKEGRCEGILYLGDSELTIQHSERHLYQLG
jgi:hypothetical protein